MEGLKVLVVDDDPNVHEIINLYFDKQNISVVHAHDGETGVELVELEDPDIVILDVMMPKMDGFDTCREIRRGSDLPIIMLTAKGDEVDRILGLELGADDYVTKPFSPRELMSRIKAIFRRLRPRDQEEMPLKELFEFHELTIDLKRREVYVNKEKAILRPKEFDLLVFLVKSPGIVYTREQLLEHVWGYDYIGDIRTVDVHVKKIRQKLNHANVDYLQTVWGVGYKFEVST
jgi:two-component system, OmpR family, response regulator ResD